MAIYVRGDDGDSLSLPLDGVAMNNEPSEMLEYAAMIRRAIQAAPRVDGVALNQADDGSITLFVTVDNGEVLALPVGYH